MNWYKFTIKYVPSGNIVLLNINNMQVYNSTKKYRKFNEDGIVVNENLFFIFDGLDDIHNKVYDEASPTSIFVDFIVKKLSKLDDFNEPEQVIETIAHIVNEFIDSNSVDTIVSTSACGALIHGNKITFFSIGDGAILINYKNKTKLIFGASDLDELNQRVLNKTKQLKLENPAIDPMEFPYTYEMINKNRSLANKPNGYKIISNEYKMKMLPFKAKTCSLDKLDAFAIMSHGFFQIFDTFHILHDYNEFFTCKKSLEQLQESIIDAEKEDEFMYKYNRLKKQDDASVIKVVLK